MLLNLIPSVWTMLKLLLEHIYYSILVLFMNSL